MSTKVNRATNDLDHANEDEREATELRTYNQPTSHNAASVTTAADDDSCSVRTNRLKRQRPESLLESIRSFWTRHVVVVAPHEACRDHFALERTFLGYLRTSLALSMLGVLIAQLFRLQHSLDDDPILGFYVAGVPLATACNGAAAIVVVLGACRFWRQQSALARGKVYAGGWEMVVIGLVILLVSMAIFLVIVVIDIKIG